MFSDTHSVFQLETVVVEDCLQRGSPCGGVGRHPDRCFPDKREDTDIHSETGIHRGAGKVSEAQQLLRSG